MDWMWKNNHITTTTTTTKKKKRKKIYQKTYNTWYSPIVTDPTTNQAVTGLSRWESGRDPEFSRSCGRM
ncbi:hypothetical protein M426DRAFT_320657 [Hypoxylon sp. CI-4A]|nr:hypothetical protein M426DRAFT_320657 [Hypoxylon sp. CI-4A]